MLSFILNKKRGAAKDSSILLVKIKGQVIKMKRSKKMCVVGATSMPQKHLIYINQERMHFQCSMRHMHVRETGTGNVGRSCSSCQTKEKCCLVKVTVCL